MKDLNYDERMHRRGLLSLELRRLHLDLIFGYKVVFGLVGVNINRDNDRPFPLRNLATANCSCSSLITSRCASLCSCLHASPAADQSRFCFTILYQPFTDAICVKVAERRSVHWTLNCLHQCIIMFSPT